MTALLTLRRLIVMRRGRALFDEAFHKGVNIIHGDNGSGKSTIADFIFFVLGGDLRDWRPHAELAESVFAEIQASESLLTLRRDVAKEASRPMQVYFGAVDDALKAGPALWQLLSYKRPEKGYSFSQVLFKSIGIPEAISEGSSNITMHQLLRLMYVDQLTPIQRLFRDENFDTWQARQAVGELLCGVGGYDLYDKQIEAREVSREFDAVSAQFRNLTIIAAGYGDKILPEQIETAIRNVSAERDTLLGRLAGISEEADISDEQQDEADALRRRTAREFNLAKRSVATLEDKIETLEYEITDAGRFIAHIEQSLAEFQDAAVAFFALGQVRFDFCPSCFTPISESKSDHHCHLCGSEISTEQADSKALAVRLDLEMQLRESRALQTDREKSLTQLKSDLRIAKLHLGRAANADELARRGAFSGREQIVAELSRKVGFLDSELEVLQRRLELAHELERIGKQKEELNQRITRLNNAIQAIVAAQATRKSLAYTRVSENAKHVLDNDLAEHSDFGQVDKITFDFAGDWIAVNDEKNRSRSASGMVVLKNSFFVGLFVAALQDPKFNLPRFMLLDNIEDKGMVQERSWNFQRQIIQMTEGRQVDHQIIFTTSKIDPALADTAYVVGRKYTKAHPTLQFADGDGVLDKGLV